MLAPFVVVLLSAAPTATGTRVTDDTGCQKGLDAQNELDGEIVCTFPNGAKRYEGLYAHGKRVGVAKTWRDDGKLASVEHFVDGKRSGLVETYSYRGWKEEACEYKDDVKHGPCSLFGAEGVLREKRNYVAGQQRGAYEELWPNGKTKERGFLDDAGKRHGELLRFRDTGANEELDTYVHGAREGVAREWYPNGQLQREEQWKNNQRHGLAKSWHENGQLRETTCYQADRPVAGVNACVGKTGPEVVSTFFANGKPQRVESLANGKRDGVRREYRLDGTLEEEATYRGDKLDGVLTRYDEQGKKSVETTYRAGQRQGLERRFFADTGQPSEETLWADDRKRERTTWWMNGKKKLHETRDGDVLLRQTWHDTGKQATEERYGGHEWRDGEQREWSEDGVLIGESHWARNERDGLQREYEVKTGKLLLEESWSAGVLKTRKTYEHGVLLKTEEFLPDGSRK